MPPPPETSPPPLTPVTDLDDDMPPPPSLPPPPEEDYTYAEIIRKPKPEVTTNTTEAETSEYSKYTWRTDREIQIIEK